MQIEQNIPLAPFTTLRIGGSAHFFAKATREAHLLEAVRFAEEKNIQIFILGGGSNLVVPDEGFPGLVLHVAIEGRILSGLQGKTTKVRFQVPAGINWDEFVDTTCEGRYSGVECLAGIPGSVGGTPVQNVGAYGQEVSQTIYSVRVFEIATHAFHDLSADECQFGYRSSIFNTTHRGKFIVTRVAFEFDLDAPPQLTYADLVKHFAGQVPPKPKEIVAAVRQIRATKGMYLDPATPDDPDHRSAGSFFKNPIVPASALAPIAQALNISAEKIPHWPTPTGEIKLPAAWLIEQAGFPKGFTLGPVGISSRHTLALINRTGTATCADLLRLRDLIAAEVHLRFQILLEQEPVFLK